MGKKIFGILVCILLIAVVRPVSGNIKNVTSLNEIDDKISPLVSDKWIKTYGGTNYENGVSAQQTPDGGYIVLGSAQNADFWLIKTDSSGNIMWDKTFGGDDEEWPESLEITSDGGYLMFGVTRSYGAGDHDFWLVKTDSEGNKIWEKTLGNEYCDWGYEARQTADGGYILTGRVMFNFTNGDDIWLIKTDSEGNKIWEKTFGGEYNDGGWSVKQTNDLGYIILGGQEDMRYQWIIKTDSNGEMQWEKIYNRNGILGRIEKTTDGGFILLGGLFNEQTYNDIWMAKTDSYGEISWEKTFDYTWGDIGNSIQQTKDGGYIILGWITDSKISDAILIKTDSTGEEIWRKTYGGPLSDYPRGVQQTQDGGYIITGDYSKFLKRTDLWLIKTDGNGTVSKSQSKNLIPERTLNLFQYLLNIFERLIKTKISFLLNFRSFSFYI